MSHNITVESGKSVRLPTSGKYCDRDIIITATGGGEQTSGIIGKSWESLVNEGHIHINSGTLTTNYDADDDNNYSDDALYGDLVIPNDGSVAYIGHRAFSWLDSLFSITLPDAVLEIDDYAFMGTKYGLKLIIGDGCNPFHSRNSFDGGMFGSITVSENNPYVKSIDGSLYGKDGKSLFKWCCGKSEQFTISIPDGTQIIVARAFESGWCEQLNIPNSITHIDGEAFAGFTCNQINFAGTVAQWNAIDGTQNLAECGAEFVQCTDGIVSLML